MQAEVFRIFTQKPNVESKSGLVINFVNSFKGKISQLNLKTEFNT